jgi:leader peptidase (prepilin peptidase) / N-methyltransferase
MWLVYLGFAAPLTWIDIRHHRLPNRIVLGFFIAMLAALMIAGIMGGQWSDVVRALLGGTALFVSFTALALFFPASIGMGDAKLSWPVGIALAWLSWSALWWGMVLAFLVAGVVGTILVSLRQRHWHSAMAFGPFLLISAPVCGLAASMGAI